jgi:hypothetical protein
MIASAAMAQPCIPSWTEPSPLGLNDAAYAMAVFNDGTGPALFVGGYFTTAGGNAASRIAKWNGTSFSNLGVGVNSNVTSFAVFDDGSGPALFVGGTFTTAGGNTANRIAKWDGHNWTTLGAGLTNNVQSLCVFDDGTGPHLYAGGGFSSPFGGSGFVSKWTGSVWSNLGQLNGVANSLVVFNDGSGAKLYAGGSFSVADNNQVGAIARWNGSTWEALPAGGVNGSVNAMLPFTDSTGPSLCVAGGFGSAGTASALNVVRLTTTFAAMGGGSARAVYALANFDDGTGTSLYLGAGVNAGPFGTSSGFVSRWDGGDGAAWTQQGATMNLPVTSLGVYNDGRSALFAGGPFTAIDAPAIRFARWGCPPPPPCGSADFNCDGDVGTDADIESFFACLSGTCPSLPCTSTADFNHDGDIGTDADIEAFFRVLGGGTC